MLCQLINDTALGARHVKCPALFGAAPSIQAQSLGNGAIEIWKCFIYNFFAFGSFCFN